MIRSGIEARCDRCGLTEFFPDAKTLGEITVHKWELIAPKGLLCPQCSDLFNKMKEQFFNEFWDK